MERLRDHEFTWGRVDGTLHHCHVLRHDPPHLVVSQRLARRPGDGTNAPRCFLLVPTLVGSEDLVWDRADPAELDGGDVTGYRPVRGRPLTWRLAAVRANPNREEAGRDQDDDRDNADYSFRCCHRE